MVVSCSIVECLLLYSLYSALGWIDDTASIANNDYTSGAQSVSIPVRATMQTFEFVVSSNQIVEDDESLTVALNSIISPALTRMDTAVFISTSADDSSVVTIEDDDTGKNPNYVTIRRSFH